MIKIQLLNFQDGVECKSILFTSKESFFKVSHSFVGGNIYGLISDFGCGSWGLVTCLGGRCEHPDGEVFLNDERIECSELKKYSCFISESLYDGINSTQDYLTPRKCIEKALSISGLPYTVEEIKNMFNLSGDGINCPVNDGRFNRDLRHVSGEIWNISIAVGFALGKEIFCFPWLNEREISRVQEPHIKILKENKKIVLIPSNQKKPLKRVCDEILLFGKDRITKK
jgi:hypothetical protein